MQTTVLPNRSEQRDAWMDIARGIGVILVVEGHVLKGLVTAGIFPSGPIEGWLDFTVYTFHMPLFFFLAGLNVTHSLLRGRRPFFRRKLQTIAYPYFVWSLIQGGVIMLLARDVNVPLTAYDLAAIPVRPIGQFWFLYVLLICHAVAASVRDRRALVLFAVAGLGVFATLPQRPDVLLSLHHFAFYLAGMLLSRWTASQAGGRWRSAILVWTGFAAAALLGGLSSGLDPLALVALPAGVLGIWGVVLLAKTIALRDTRVLRHLGAVSLTIYVMHILAGSGTRLLMVRLHVPPNAWLYLAAGTAVGVMLPVLAHTVLHRLGMLGVFGLGPWRRARPSTPAGTPSTI